MRLRVVAASALAVLALGGLAACGHDKPGPAPTTVTPTRPPTTAPPTTPVPTRTTMPPTDSPTVTPPTEPPTPSDTVTN